MSRVLLLAFVAVGNLLFSTEVSALEGAMPVDYRSAMPRTASPERFARVEVRNATLALDETVSVFAKRLQGKVRAAEGYSIADVQNLESLDIEVEYAELEIGPQTMKSMVQAELDRIRAPLRIATVHIVEGELQLTGSILRHGRWLPFEMAGYTQVEPQNRLRLKLTQMSIRGEPLRPALLAADVRFVEILTLNSKVVTFDSRDMLLNLGQLLPAPVMQFELTGLSLEQGVAKAVLGHANQASVQALNCEQACPDSYLFARGGVLTAVGVALEQVPVLVTPEVTGPPEQDVTQAEGFRLSLSEFQPTLAASRLRLRTDGAVWMQIPKVSSPQTRALANDQIRFLTLSKRIEQSDSEALLIAGRSTEIVTPQDVVIEIDHLLATAQGSKLERLPFLALKALTGQVSLSTASVENLLNRVTFFYPQSPVRKVRVTKLEATELELALEVSPAIWPASLTWLPVTLRGQFSVADQGRSLRVRPSEIWLHGVPMMGTLQTLGLDLEDLLNIENRPDVSLKGFDLDLRLAQALPPLSVNTQLQRLTGDAQAGKLRLLLAAPPGEATEGFTLDQHVQTLSPGLWLRARQLRAFGVSLPQSISQVKQKGEKRLRIELTQYPEVLEKASLTMPQPGFVQVTLD